MTSEKYKEMEKKGLLKVERPRQQKGGMESEESLL